MRPFLATLFLCLFAVPSHAKPPRLGHVTKFDGDRYAAAQATPAKRLASQRTERHRAKKPRAYKHRRPAPIPAPRAIAESGRANAAGLASGLNREVARAVVIGGRPAGCPFRFCGCALSIKLFGRIIPTLNLAANWLRFPRAAPAPGMVAARRGHVFKLLAHRGGHRWQVWDANSGRGRIRIHDRSIAGYQIVNPHGGVSELSARRRRA